MARFFEGNPCTYEVYATVTGKWAVVKHFPMGNAHYYERFKTETEAIEFCKADNGAELIELDIDEIE